MAVNHRMKNIVQILLDVLGVNVNQLKPASRGWLPALHTAVRNGESEWLKC
jgi:hypothetical protein